MKVLGKVFVMVLLGVLIGKANVWALDNCVGNSTSCGSWGPHDHMGTCCRPRTNIRGFDSSPDEFGWCHSRNHPNVFYCGDELDTVWDPDFEDVVCGSVIALESCGGGATLIGGCDEVKCGS